LHQQLTLLRKLDRLLHASYDIVFAIGRARLQDARNNQKGFHVGLSVNLR